MPTLSLTDDIRDALAKSDVPSVEIARRIDINPVNLSHFKAGRMNLTVDKLERLAQVLGLQISVKPTKKKK